MKFGAEQSEAPDRMTRKNFNNILSTCFTREIVSLYFILFITNQLTCYILSNQGRYDKLNVISLVNPGLLIICALEQVTCITQVKFKRELN